MKCPSCGAEAAGKFCSACGSPLQLVSCASCGSGNTPGNRFCTSCGKPLPGARRKKAGGGPSSGGGVPAGVAGTGGAGAAAAGPAGSGTLAWWVAGGLLIVVIIALGYPILTRDSSVTGGAGGAVPPGMGGGGSEMLDLTQMSPDSLATLLFNRVMMSNSTGDTADVEFFLPKAFTIYEQVSPTDPDGLYHYALLHLVDQDYEAALAKAAEGLAQVPDYLLLLAVSGEASAAQGDSSAAREFYTRYLDLYDTEMALLRPGYEHHQRIFPQYLAEARAFLGEG